MRFTAVVLMGLFLCGCATAPAKFTFDPVANVTGDYDDVWSAVVEYFAIGNLPIDTIEKDSGLIVTSWMDASSSRGSGEDKTLCDCGGPGLLTQHWTRGKFSVFVKAADPGKVDLRVTCTYQQRRSFRDSYSTVNCSSKGELERQLHEYVQAKVEHGATPDVPTFAPGQGE